MGLFSKNKGDQSTSDRLFFATDLHGSEVCFRKFLSAAKVYKAGTVIMGGDCTGKMLVPVIELADGTWASTLAGEHNLFKTEEAVQEYEKQVRNGGSYTVRLDEEEAARVGADPKALESLFSEVMLETLAGWVALAEERLAEAGVHVIMTPGNDDEWEVDEVLHRSEFIDAADGKITRIGPHEMLSLSWSNKTPWSTARECSEEELTDKIEALAGQIEDMENAIFNIHVPPYGIGLDEAPELDETQKPRAGVMTGVGSTAVSEAILKYQPLLSLHGHVHEARGAQQLGRTIAINPGSTYGEWALQGVVVDLLPGKVERYTLTSG